MKKLLLAPALLTALLLAACASGPVQMSDEAMALGEKCRQFHPKMTVDGQEPSGDFIRPIRLSSQPPKSPGPNRFGVFRTAEVCITAKISVEGKIKDPVVVHSTNDEYTENVLKSLETWEFQPAVLNGDPVEVSYLITLTFRRKGT